MLERQALLIKTYNIHARMSSLDKPYEPKTTEPRIYEMWERSGYFNPDKLPKRHKKPFTIIMPPPNANAPLHIGHAVFTTLEDIMIRFARMRGRKALWVPGADHAGFETQVVFDKKLEREGRSRFKIPQEELYREMLAFTAQNRKTMERQLRTLGVSCDWSRNAFTLDAGVIRVVYETFKRLYEDGLVYRDKKIVNWCAKHQTTLSDLEVTYVERKDPLYYMRYGPFVLATARPETKFGDTAVAVHPKDKRYKAYIGKDIEIETLLGSAIIHVIADDAVDIKFGTGVVKVTPAHDPNDFEMGRRHNLEVREVIDQYGRLNEKTGPYQGMKVMEARKVIVEELKKRGLLVKIDKNYVHNVATCYKCGTTVEPRVMLQWFLAMTAAPKNRRGKRAKSLRDLAVDAVKSRKVRFVTKRYEKIFFHWMRNIRDWNISRQIVWGIPIPAYYCDTCGTVVIDIADNAKQCAGCNGVLRKETDTFDTWFSSGQWPFAVLLLRNGKSVKRKAQSAKLRNIFDFTTRDFKTFYPTDVMETGWDILFFWVARMIMLGLYATGKPPFRNVYLHGLVRNKEKQKMSKSKGNVIDPLGIVETYGTDALRMALVVGNAPGNDAVISEDKIRAYKHFANKIWNASRFVLIQRDDSSSKKPALTATDRQQLVQLTIKVQHITALMEQFQFYRAADELYRYFWHTFADRIIESAKPRLRSDDPKDRRAARYVLRNILVASLKMLHPFMPFVTEAIWGHIKQKGHSLLMIEQWPIR